MNTIIEQAKAVPIVGEYDVAVVGGGIAGIAAALAAKRAGAEKVLLLEREFVLGGLATQGLVAIYEPICDGNGKQVNFGIAEELLRLSVQYGTEDPRPNPWLTGGDKEAKIKQRFRVSYNPNVFAIEAEQLLLKEGVELLYGTVVCGVEKEGDKIKYLYLENKSGRSAIKVYSVVDCSGDADVCKLSGAKTSEYTRGNDLASWCYALYEGQYRLRWISAPVPIPEEYADKLTPVPLKKYRAIEGTELTEQTIDMHANIMNYFHTHLHSEISLTSSIACIPSIPQIRMTRKLDGAYALDILDRGKRFEDAVGAFSDWRKPDFVVELPFRSLYGVEVKNLIAAGRCISTTEEMWDISRVIPCCAVSGEAAGAAAAMTDDFASLDVKKLQAHLVNKGVALHYER